MRQRPHTFVDLNTTDAELIIRELGAVLDADRAWADKFQTMLICRTKPTKLDLEPNSHKKTAFGRWFYGKVHVKVRDHPGFSGVGKKSDTMHGNAYGLACAIRDDLQITPSQYKTFTKSVGLFRGSLRPLLSEAWEFLRHADPLTGVMTRGAMNMHLENEQDRAKRSNQTSCVAMMDLDHFKKVNDVHGHTVGDKVLESVSSFLLSSLRQYDKLFRYGGEEFLIMFPNTTVENAEKVLNRLRKNISQLDVEVGPEEKLTITASFGVALLQLDKSPKNSIEYADQALYSAKQAGRNRVRMWEKDSAPIDQDIPDTQPE